MDFKLLRRYDFQTHAPEILGQDFRAATLIAILTFDDVVKEADPQARHAALYPYLPVGTQRDFRYLTYLKFRLTDGSTVILAQEWIRSESVEERNEVTITITVPNASLQDQQIIQEALSQNGIQNFELTVN